MDTQSLTKCGFLDEENTKPRHDFQIPNLSTGVSEVLASASANAINYDPGLPHVTFMKSSGQVVAPNGPPNLPSTLWNSMIYPLVTFPLKTFLWCALSS